MKLTAYLAAAVVALAPTAASAGFVLIDVQTGPEVMVRAPVAAVDDVTIPGTPGPGSTPDFYKSPGGVSAIDGIWANQCRMLSGVITAGTQDADGNCIANGTLASGGGGGTPARFIAGSPYVPGLYETPYWGIEIPAGDHLFDHVHEREE